MIDYIISTLILISNEVLAIADIEKMYIPPEIDPKKGLFENQLLTEKMVVESLSLLAPKESKLLDIGCGRGRIAHYISTLIGAKVSGFNIDASQVKNAIEYAQKTGYSQRLDLKVGDHHKPFAHPDSSFDGAYSVQAVWFLHQPCRAGRGRGRGISRAQARGTLLARGVPVDPTFR